MGDRSVMGDGVDCYCVAPIRIDEGAIVSQRAYLCSASHDYNKRSFPLVTAPIHIGRGAWVAAEAFVGPGITVEEGAVVAARSVVTKNVMPWEVVAGNPAKPIGMRNVTSESASAATEGPESDVRFRIVQPGESFDEH
ncbi:putative colanic acid biosynthesis acetyltransferase [Mesorhizobium sp. M1006]|uniref:putative colanic acid biosynthesis acetyltransferase n=1 Tax=Mesorhizobium sp. M1006 TaxID=2957048 RepID=UPI00333D153C